MTHWWPKSASACEIDCGQVLRRHGAPGTRAKDTRHGFRAESEAARRPCVRDNKAIKAKKMRRLPDLLRAGIFGRSAVAGQGAIPGCIKPDGSKRFEACEVKDFLHADGEFEQAVFELGRNDRLPTSQVKRHFR